MSKYRARSGTTFRDTDAQLIGRFLDEQFPDGDYTPEEVVELARPKASPIHRYFEWDDTRAAYLYRLQQARKLIQCVVEIIDGVEAPKAVSVFVKEEDHHVYMNTRKAKEIPEAWHQVLEDALAGLSAWRRRYEVFKQLKELGPVLRAIKQLEGKQHAKTKQRDRSSKTSSKKVRRQAGAKAASRRRGTKAPRRS